VPITEEGTEWGRTARGEPAWVCKQVQAISSGGAAAGLYNIKITSLSTMVGASKHANASASSARWPVNVSCILHDARFKEHHSSTCPHHWLRMLPLLPQACVEAHARVAAVVVTVSAAGAAAYFPVLSAAVGASVRPGAAFSRRYLALQEVVMLQGLLLLLHASLRLQAAAGPVVVAAPPVPALSLHVFFLLVQQS
jgi:hypothetical protein